jgi:hypothetical protein
MLSRPTVVVSFGVVWCLFRLFDDDDDDDDDDE